MADRYYIPAEQVQEISGILTEWEDVSPELVEHMRRLVFATPIPDDLADDIERSMDNSETGLSI